MGVESSRPFRLPLRAPCPASAAVLRRNVPAPLRRFSPFRQGDGTLFPNAARPYASRTAPRFLNGVSSGSPEAQSPSGASEDRSSAVTATQPRTLPQIPAEFGAPVSPPFGAAEWTGTVPSASNVGKRFRGPATPGRHGRRTSTRRNFSPAASLDFRQTALSSSGSPAASSGNSLNTARRALPSRPPRRRASS